MLVDNPYNLKAPSYNSRVHYFHNHFHKECVDKLRLIQHFDLNLLIFWQGVPELVGSHSYLYQECVLIYPLVDLSMKDKSRNCPYSHVFRSVGCSNLLNRYDHLS